MDDLLDNLEDIADWRRSPAGTIFVKSKDKLKDTWQYIGDKFGKINQKGNLRK